LAGGLHCEAVRKAEWTQAAPPCQNDGVVPTAMVAEEIGKVNPRVTSQGGKGSTRSGLHVHWGHVRMCVSNAEVACASSGRLTNSGARGRVWL
jgi:hypothetical protein